MLTFRRHLQHSGLRFFVVFALALIACQLQTRSLVAQQLSVDFQDIRLAPETDWEGPVSPEMGVDTPGDFGGITRAGYWSSGPLEFINRYTFDTDFGDSWSGFALSSRTDTTTPGFTNDTSAFAGGGVQGSDDPYAIGFGNLANPNWDNPSELDSLPHFDIPQTMRLDRLAVTNTSYAALSMQEGDPFAKQFGGEGGDDPDYFRLSIYGSDANGEVLDNVVDFFLADFRHEDPRQDYIVDTWQTIDLSPLASASRIYFNLDSSDTGQFGMNTPAYFAMDQIQLSAALLGDADFNGQFNGNDLDLICSGITDNNASMDLNMDGLTDLIDFELAISEYGIQAGDVDTDGSIGFGDFTVLAANFGGSGFWTSGDFDCDNQIAFNDFLILAANLQQSREIASVPEPTGILGLLFTFMIGLRWLPNCQRRCVDCVVAVASN